MAEPLTLRYNNPGAIEYKPFLDKYGATLGPNGRYAQFPDRASGYKAMEGLLGTYQDKHGLNTVGGIVNRWAPPNVDNNSTSQYTAHVAKQLGVDPDAPIDRARIPQLAEAMASYEAGRPVPRDGGVSVPQTTGAAPAMAAGIPTPASYSGMGPSEVDQRRKMAQALMSQGMDASPVGHWTQGLARVLQGGLGGYYQGSANRAEREGQAAAGSQLTQALNNGGNLEGAVGGMLSNPYSADVGQKLATGIIAQRMKGPELTEAQKNYAYGQKNPGFAQREIELKQAARPQTNIDMKGETKFSEEAGKVDAKRLSENAEQGQAARVAQGDIDRLDELSNAIGTQGAVAGVKQALGPYATALGIKIDGLDDIQAFSAVVSRLAPTMRPPGSGATSDFEFKQFLNALPQLSQTVEGRKLVMDQMRALNGYKAQAGELSEKMLTGELDRKTGMAELRKLGNPLSLWRQGAQALPPSQPAPAQGAGRFAQPQMSPAGAMVDGIRQQIQSGQVQVPQVIEQARKAIQEGRDPAAIKRRLEEIGINPADVGL